MNDIPLAQNEAEQLARLAAQRQLYATAKTIFGWQLVLSGPVTVWLAFLPGAIPEAKPYVALYGSVLSLLDVCVLTPWMRHLRGLAAKIQEQFDCEVLQLPWSDVKAGHKPDPELVSEQARKYEAWGAQMPPLTDWYSPEVGSLPLHVARIACQRSNCWWDARQRRRYAGVVIGIVLVILLIVVIAAMQSAFTLEDLFLRVLVPLSPVLLLGYRQVTEQWAAASRLDRLKEHTEQLWKEAMSGASKAQVTTKSRALQDEILDNRGKSPLVFDALFKRLRKEYEVQMNESSAQLAREAVRGLGL